LRSLKTLIHLLVFRPIIKLIFGINIYGKSNIHDLNNYIIIANHNSHLDIFLLFYLLPVKHISITHPVAAKEYFSRSKILFGLINYLFSPVWITRGDTGKREDAINSIKGNLDRGHNIIMFPEGTRGEPGKILPFKTGVGRLSEEYHNIPIVPVFLHGPERALPKKSFLPMPVCNDIFIAPPQVFKESYIETTHILEQIIKELSETENVRHHRRHKRKTRFASAVAILGIDGSGKSTISRIVAGELSTESTSALISDKLEFYENGELRKMQPLVTEKIREIVGSYAKSARSLKLYKVPKLTEMLLRDYLTDELNKWYNPAHIVMDGCTLLNLTAWAVLYREEYFNEEFCLKAIRILSSMDENIDKNDPVYSHFPELMTIKRLKLNHMTLPDVVMFLDVEPDIAMQRIEQRGENKQVHETQEKLNKLRDAYQMTCKVVKENLNVPTRIINGNDTIENISMSANDFIRSSLG